MSAVHTALDPDSAPDDDVIRDHESARAFFTDFLSDAQPCSDEQEDSIRQENPNGSDAEDHLRKGPRLGGSSDDEVDCDSDARCGPRQTKLSRLSRVGQPTIRNTVLEERLRTRKIAKQLAKTSESRIKEIVETRLAKIRDPKKPCCVNKCMESLNDSEVEAEIREFNDLSEPVRQMFIAASIVQGPTKMIQCIRDKAVCVSLYLKVFGI